MGLFRTCYLLSLTVIMIKCAPTDPQSPFYTAILERCPTLRMSSNQSLFKTCSNWERISKTPALNEETRTDVLCLLYFESFTQYCNQSKQMNTTIPTAYNVDMNTICDNLDIIPEQARPESVLRKIITTRDGCIELCGDPFGGVISICTKSYYYSHQLLESAKSRPHMVSVKETRNHLFRVKPEVKQFVEPNQKDSESQGKVYQDTQTEDEIAKDSKVQTNGDVIPEKIGEDKHPQVVSDGDAVVPQSSQIDGGALDKIVKPNTGHSVKPDNKQVQNDDIPKTKEKSVDNPKIENKPKTEEKKIEDQVKPVLTLTSSTNDETINMDNNPNTQVDKNPEKNEAGDNEDFVKEDINPPNNDHLESEEEMEEQTKQLGDKSPKPKELDETDEAVNYTTEMDGDSYFFTYFMLLCVIFIVGYVCYHNKQKILALILEGRRGKRQYRGRRPNSANYHKLDSNLEEAITSSCNKNTNNVIY